MDTVGRREQEEGPGRNNAGTLGNDNDGHQLHKVEPVPDQLGHLDVGAVLGYEVETGEKVDKAGWVHKRAGVATHVAVIQLAAEIATHFLHVCNPVDLGVRDLVDDKVGADGVQNDHREGEQVEVPVVC